MPGFLHESKSGVKVSDLQIGVKLEIESDQSGAPVTKTIASVVIDGEVVRIHFRGVYKRGPKELVGGVFETFVGWPKGGYVDQLVTSIKRRYRILGIVK